MSDEAAELQSILAAARALAEDASLRGVREEAFVPLPAPPARAEAPPPAQAPAPPRSDWSRIAADAREEGLPKALQLERIREEMGDCRRCLLCRERKQIVFGVGTPEADLLVIGEAPGFHEDDQGEPFVGPAGQMLDKMLENVLGLRRDQVYILNVVKCRPPKNRNPLPEEVEACRPFLDAQFSAIAPKVALVLGSIAYKTVFRTDDGITRRRGRWHEYQGVPVMPTFHPAYLLRKPEDKRYTFDDLKQVRDRYDRVGGKR